MLHVHSAYSVRVDIIFYRSSITEIPEITQIFVGGHNIIDIIITIWQNIVISCAFVCRVDIRLSWKLTAEVWYIEMRGSPAMRGVSKSCTHPETDLSSITYIIITQYNTITSCATCTQCNRYMMILIFYTKSYHTTHARVDTDTSRIIAVIFMLYNNVYIL